jgi:hypothetical protein
LKKSDLYTFIEKKVAAKVGEEFRKYQDIRHNEIEPMVHEAVTEWREGNGIDLDSLVTELFKQFETVNELTLGFLNNNYYARNFKYYGENLKKEANKKVGQAFISDIFDKVAYGHDYKHVVNELDNKVAAQMIINKLDEYVAQKKISTKTTEALNKLGAEANQVVKMSPSAKQAYKSLLSLGFPMDDFTVGENALPPAIQKFSVDTCILKDEGCGKETVKV